MSRIEFVLVLGFLWVAQPAVATDFVVTRYDDPPPAGCLVADCSVREALIAANASADADRILLSAGLYTINLPGAGENFAATGDLDIRQSVEVLGVGAGVTRITSVGIGEGLWSGHTPGITIAFRDLTIENTDRGAISATGTTTIERCEVRGSGTTGSTAAVVAGINSALTIRDSAIVATNGTGLLVSQGTATIENATFADSTSAQIGVNVSPQFSCLHCTLTGSGAGQLELTVFESAASFTSTVVVGECFVDVDSVLSPLGGNRESPGSTCHFDHALDLDGILAANLQLGALADNGGPTPTILPAAGSAAINGANSAFCPDFDQRGQARDTQCDSGAVERSTFLPPTPLFLDGFEQGDSEAWSAAVP